MRTHVALLALLAACSSGGGSAPPPAPTVDPNPSPTPTAVASIDMAGDWQVTQAELISTSSPYHAELPVGTTIRIHAGSVVSAEINGATVQTMQSGLEFLFGFPLDWYQNSGNNSTHAFGFGWDRLSAHGGGGQFSDYYQYGVQVAAISNTLMVAFEAEERQTFLGEPRTEWLASLILARVQ